MPSSCGRPSNRLCALLIVLFAAPAWAEIRLEGRIEQGGLAVGRAEPGARVHLDGRAVPVDRDGLFLLGFGRDAPATAELRVTSPDGADEVRALAVGRRQWPEQRVEGLPRDKVEPDAASLARLKAEAEMVKAVRAAITTEARFSADLQWPAQGATSSPFGVTRFYNGIAGAPHSGLDIAAPAGAPVRAVADGVVVLAAPDLFLTGRTVMIDHGLGLISTYAHLSRLDVAPGRAVGKGQMIGAVGTTGLSTGAHLHWGMSWLDLRLDPETVSAALQGAPP